MATKPKTPYVVNDPNIIALFTDDSRTPADTKVKLVVQMLKENPGKPVAIPKGYVSGGLFSKYNKESTEDHVTLRGWAHVKDGKANEYYAFLRKGPSQPPYSRKLREAQKAKRLEQAKKQPEEYPEPEVVDAPE